MRRHAQYAAAILRFAALLGGLLLVSNVSRIHIPRELWLALFVLACVWVVIGYVRLKRALGVDYLLLPVAYGAGALFYVAETRHGLSLFGWVLLVEAAVLIRFRGAVVRFARYLSHALPGRARPRRWWLLVPLHHALLLAATWVALTWMSPLDCGEPRRGVSRVLTSCEVGDWEHWYRTLPDAPQQIDASPRDAFCGRTCDTIHVTFGWEDHATGLAPIVTLVKESVRAVIEGGGRVESRVLSRWRIRGVTWATSPFAGECDPVAGRCVVTSPIAGGVIVTDADSGRVRRVLDLGDLSPSDVDLAPTRSVSMILGRGRARGVPAVPGLALEERVAIDWQDSSFVAATLDLASGTLTAEPLRGNTSRAVNGERFYNVATDSADVFVGPHLRIASLRDATIRAHSPGWGRLLWSGGVTAGAVFAVNPALGVRAVYVGYPFMGIGELIEGSDGWKYARTIATPDGGRSLAYDPARDLLFQANYEMAKVFAIERATGRIVDGFDVADRVRHLHLRDDTLVVASQGGIVRIDLGEALDPVLRRLHSDDPSLAGAGRYAGAPRRS